MRILFITPMHADFHSGGLARSARRISSGLELRGHEVTVLVFDSGRQHQPGVRVPTVYTITRERRPRIVFIPRRDAVTGIQDEIGPTAARLQQSYFRIRQCSERFCPDVIISFFPYSLGHPARLVAHAAKVPQILAFRGNDLGRFVHDPQAMPVLAGMLESAAAAVYLSTDLMQLAEAITRRTPPGRIIFNGIPQEILDRRWSPPRNSAPVFGSLGIFKPKKGIEVFLNAVKENKDLRKRSLLVGEFTRSPTQSWRSPVRVTGLVGHDEALRLLNGIDVFLAPSTTDGCPNAVLEAMAAGRAVLCTRVAAMADFLVHGESAWFLPDWSVEAMTDAIAALDRDAALRHRLGRGARAIAEGLTVERELDGWCDTLDEAVKAHNSGEHGTHH